MTDYTNSEIQKNKDIEDTIPNLPDNIKGHAQEMRKLRMNQKWTSKEEAYKQCRRVESRD